MSDCIHDMHAYRYLTDDVISMVDASCDERLKEVALKFQGFLFFTFVLNIVVGAMEIWKVLVYLLNRN